MFDFKDKTAVVTGGAQGIGKCISEEFKKHGANVAIIDLKENDSKKAWSYGQAPSSYEEFYARYDGLTTALLDNPKMFGFCYTQLTDVEQEINGLFEFVTRKPKFDMEIISKINKKKAAIED